MVVYGRNERARAAMFGFLRALGLSPIEWDEAVNATGKGTPHNLEAVRAAMAGAQAVVVLLTAEDEARIHPSLATPGERSDLAGQPRLNVILEAGLAMATDPTRTILVELGPIRHATDLDGLNAVRITNQERDRERLRSRLETAECDLQRHGSDWLTPETGGDFDGAVLPSSVARSETPEPAEALRRIEQNIVGGTDNITPSDVRAVSSSPWLEQLLTIAASTTASSVKRRQIAVALVDIGLLDAALAITRRIPNGAEARTVGYEVLARMATGVDVGDGWDFISEIWGELRPPQRRDLLQRMVDLSLTPPRWLLASLLEGMREFGWHRPDNWERA